VQDVAAVLYADIEPVCVAEKPAAVHEVATAYGAYIFPASAKKPVVAFVTDDGTAFCDESDGFAYIMPPCCA
jgi:hypothetical protein